MTDTPTTRPFTARLVHLGALVTVCATLPLLSLGAEVTTKQVGMVDHAWPTTPWHLAFSGWQEKGLGYLIEHSHRLAGYVVGCCVILLNVGLWLWEPRRWVRWLGLAALLGVIVQGLLGGFRVLLHAWFGTQFAMIHGCFAQIVFALLVSLAVVTGRRWSTAAENAGLSRPTWRRWSLLLVAVVYVQIILGAWVRHLGTPLSQRLHLLLAFAVVGVGVILLSMILTDPERDRRLTRPAVLLGVLMLAQILLGVEAWMIQFRDPLARYSGLRSPAADGIRTGHVLIGALLFAAAVALALYAHRQAILARAMRIHPVHPLEGAA
ncbi:MAG: COX15/CtaA family protein [Gemmataceae bacterium]